MEYMTMLEMSNISGAGKEFIENRYPGFIKDLNKQIEQLDRLERKEEENLSIKSSDSDYEYFTTNKWAHFQIGLYTIRETKKRLKGFRAELNKELNKGDKVAKEESDIFA